MLSAVIPLKKVFSLEIISVGLNSLTINYMLNFMLKAIFNMYSDFWRKELNKKWMQNNQGRSFLSLILKRDVWIILSNIHFFQFTIFTCDQACLIFMFQFFIVFNILIMRVELLFCRAADLWNYLKTSSLFRPMIPRVCGMH